MFVMLPLPCVVGWQLVAAEALAAARAAAEDLAPSPFISAALCTQLAATLHDTAAADILQWRTAVGATAACDARAASQAGLFAPAAGIHVRVCAGVGACNACLQTPNKHQATCVTRLAPDCMSVG